MSTRSRDEIRRVVLDALHKVAPEVDPSTLDPRADWVDQLDIDSVDLLNVVVGIHEALGVEIPEEDVPKLSSLDRWVAYLAERI